MCQSVCAGGLPSCQPALCVKPENLPQPVTFVPRAATPVDAAAAPSSEDAKTPA